MVFWGWIAQKFELSRGGKGHNLHPMEGLRGFAVLLVFMVHYATLVTPWIAAQPAMLAMATAVHAMGNAGVDLFFVLSGHLIYGSLMTNPQPYGRFMQRRVQRIYPTFLAVFALYLFLSMLFPAENKIPASPTAAGLYLLQNLLLLPGLFPIEPLITVAWSLSYEMFFYLCLPVLVVALQLRRWPAPYRVLLLLLVAVGIAALGLYGAAPVRLMMFVSGMLLFESLQVPRLRNPGGLVGALALLGGLSAMLLPNTGAGMQVLKLCILFVAFFLLCWVCLQQPRAWLPMLFSWTPLRWLGNMSYSYYLIHGLALKAFFLVLSHWLPATDQGAGVFWAVLPPAFLLTLLASTGLFLVVERPFSLASSPK
jgi:exopolysaccharide production protein ExoZ